MIDNFRRHQSEFQQLLEMFLSDKGLTRVDFDFTRPEDPSAVGIAQQRLDEYRRIFIDLNLTSGIGADWQAGKEVKDTVWFFAAAAGPRKSSQKTAAAIVSPL